MRLAASCVVLASVLTLVLCVVAEVQPEGAADKDMAEYYEWCNDISEVELPFRFRRSPDGSKVIQAVATRTIPHKDVIFMSDSKNMITMDKISAIFPFLSHRKGQVNTPWALALMYYTTHPETEFYVYARTLGSKARHLPLTWTAQQRAALADIGYLSDMASAIESKQRVLHEEFESLQKEFGTQLHRLLGPFFTKTNFVSYYAHATARIWRDAIATMPEGIAPCLDALGHCNTLLGGRTIGSMHSWALASPSEKTDRLFSTGDVLCMSYGAHNTPHLFFNYGVVPRVNPNDNIRLEPLRHKLEAIAPGLSEYLQKHHPLISRPFMSRNGAGEELFPFMRIMDIINERERSGQTSAPTPEEVQVIMKIATSSFPEESREIDVCHSVWKVLSGLSSLNGGEALSIENEQAWLDSHPKATPLRLAHLFRLNRKKLIQKLEKDTSRRCDDMADIDHVLFPEDDADDGREEL